MDIKHISTEFSVSGQLQPVDVIALHEAGVKTLICNRPDQELPGQPTFEQVAIVARENGIAVHHQPVVHDTINAADARAFAELLDSAAGPMHAWCGSGLRALTLWSLVQAARGSDPGDMASLGTRHGFDFNNFGTKFSNVIAELSGSFDALPVAALCPILIAGGGAAGIALAASLLRRDKSLKITIVEPAGQHYYQPGFTLVGCGVFKPEQTRRETSALIPPGVEWRQASIVHFLPDRSMVVLDDGSVLGYERLCVCTGLKLNWAGIAGLEASLGKNGVTSNYHPRLAPYTWKLVQGLKCGTAIFTQPPMPIKCAGAPQKALYLSADHWRRNGRDIDIHFYNAGGVLFGVKDYLPALEAYLQRYSVQLHLQHTLVKVDGPNHLATFSAQDADGKPVSLEVPFDMLHVVPPQCAPDCIRNTLLADRAGWVDVNPATLQHRRFANVWGVGDSTNAPNAKTAAAARKQVPVAAINIMHDIRRDAGEAHYDGYGSCPLTVENGRVVLAEFGYGGKLLPTFPLWLIEGRKPSRLAWLLKRYLLPWIYWKLMLRGHEVLAAPNKDR